MAYSAELGGGQNGDEPELGFRARCGEEERGLGKGGMDEDGQGDGVATLSPPQGSSDGQGKAAEIDGGAGDTE